MKESRKSTWRVLVLSLLLMVCLLGCAAAESADPIRVSSLSEPQSVISEQDVSITIKIYNSSQQDMQDAITLFDPEGVSVEKYNSLGAEQAVTYTGTWHVTQDQISKGKITYYIRYSVAGKDYTKTIPVTIQTEEAAPQLIANYAISPATARQGQQVNIAYTLSNTGNIELRDIAITNPGISDKTLTASSLSVGERVVLEDVFEMGSGEMICEPRITYRAANSNTVLTVEDMTRRTLTPAQDGLTVALTAENADNVYPGESIDLTVRLRNTGSSPFVGLQILLSDNTEVASGIELAAGASYETSVKWTPVQTTDIYARVIGTDAEGDPITINSEPITINTQDASMALVLNVQAAAQTETIYTEPAVVLFALKVTNLGETDATTLTVTEAGTTVATIPSLPSGESRQLAFELETSIAGQIQFAVTGKDAAGNDKTYTSNIITLVYVEPTPAPTSTPVPTAVPPTPTPVPTATPVPTFVERVTGLFPPMVLYIAAGVLAGLIILILVLSGISSSRRRRRLAQALDTIELTSDVRDSTGRHKKKKTVRQPKPKKQEEDLVQPGIVSTSELTEADIHPSEYEMTMQEPMPSAEDRNSSARRRSKMEESSNAPTLRVEPMNRRPEFPQQQAPDNSKTKVFNRPAAEEDLSQTKRMTVPQTDSQGVNPGTPGRETIRLDRAQVNEVRKQETESRPMKTWEEPEPEPKEKKRGLFGRRKETSTLDEDEYFE